MIAAAIYRDGALNRIVGVPDHPSILANTGPDEVGYAVPQQAVMTFPIDMPMIRAFYHARIDQEAGEQRGKFITDVPGQAQTYQRKEAEARAWTEGDEVANPDAYPFMIAEATLRGVSVAQVRDDILAQVNALTPIAALIEARRICAKRAVDAAPDIPAIAQAATVDWMQGVSM